MNVIVHTIAAVAVLTSTADGEFSADNSQLHLSTHLAVMSLACKIDAVQWDEQIKSRTTAGLSRGSRRKR